MAITREPVSIVGAGIFGLACALACARRGRQVVVHEARQVGAGASGGIVGALSPHVPDTWNPKKQFQFKALADAPRYWRDIEEVSGLPTGFGAIGRYLPLASPHARAMAEARVAEASENWGAVATWRIDPHPPATWIDPALASEGAVFETLSARLFPRDALLALARAGERAGVIIRQGARVEDIASLPGQVIVAAGVAGFDLLPVGTGKGVKGQAALLRPDQPARQPMIYADGIYVVPQASGLISVGSTSENSYDDGQATDGQLDRLIERAAGLCPALRGAKIVERWAGERPRAPRRDPMLGRVPGSDRVFAALGGFKIGIGIAPGVGDILAAMVDGEKVALPDSFTVSHHMKEV